jgi:hypothetical protein
VIETYKTRFEGEPAALRRIGMPGRASQVFKTIVDPAAVRHSGNLHAWVYRSGAAVDENGYPVGARHIFTKSTSFERIRINHYFARSEADLRAKYAIREAPGETLPASTEVQRMNAGIQDEAISSYVPRLREALRRRGAPVPSM